MQELKQLPTAIDDYDLQAQERDERFVFTLYKNEVLHHAHGQTRQAVHPDEFIGVYQSFLWGYLTDLFALTQEQDVMSASGYYGLTVDEIYNAMSKEENLRLVRQTYEKHYLDVGDWSEYLYNQNYQEKGYFSSLIHSNLYLKEVFFAILEKEINWLYRLAQVKELRNKIGRDESKINVTNDFMKSLGDDEIEWLGSGGYLNRLTTLSVQQNEVSLLQFLFDDIPLDENGILDLGENLLKSSRKMCNKHTYLYNNELFL